MIAAAIAAAVLAGCSGSAPPTQTSPATTAPPPATTAPPPATANPPAGSWQAVGDVDGDGRPDRARLV
jgi:hypothetical protein